MFSKRVHQTDARKVSFRIGNDDATQPSVEADFAQLTSPGLFRGLKAVEWRRGIESWHSEDVRKELRQLDGIQLQTVIKYGLGTEVQEVRQALRNLRGDSGAGKKRAATSDLTNARKRVKW